MSQFHEHVLQRTWVEIEVGADGDKHWVEVDRGEHANAAEAGSLYKKITAAGIPARVREQYLVTETTHVNEHAKDVGREQV